MAGARCLVVTTSYPRHAGDAAGCFVAARVEALRAAGEQVDVIAAGAPGASEIAGADGPVAIRRIPFAVPGGARPLFYGDGAPESLEATPAAAWLQALRFSAGLVEAIRAWAPRADRIESHWLIPCALAVAAVTERPHRAYAHSGDVALLERIPFGRTLARRLVDAGTRFVFASADLRTRFARLAGPARAPVVASSRVEAASSPLVLRPTPAEPARRLALRRSLGLPMGIPLVLGVGRLVPIKGYDLLVRAVGRLPAAGRPTVVLVGEGSERRRLEALALSRRVDLRLVGAVPHHDVARWLGAADLFAHPCRPLPNGRTEGLPVAVSEAVAAALPVIASDSGGIDELAERAGSAFFTVKADDVGAFATALERNLIATAVLRSADSREVTECYSRETDYAVVAETA